MPLMSRELYEALREAQVSPEKARKAAEDLLEAERRFTSIERDMSHMRITLDHMHQRLTTLMWTIGIGFSLTMVVLATVLNWLWPLMQRVH